LRPPGPKPQFLIGNIPPEAIYTGSSMQIPWYISWPIVVAFVVGILFIAASRERESG
jgi:hypothetical protein